MLLGLDLVDEVARAGLTTANILRAPNACYWRCNATSRATWNWEIGDYDNT